MEYLVPNSLSEAVEALRTHIGAQVISGGTDLMVGIREGHVRPSCLVDLSRIAELVGIHENGAEVRIGAATKISDIIEHPGFREAYPALVEAGELLGGWQIQNMATLGGNLCNASPAAETAPALLVYDAQLEVCGSAGRRTLPLHQFWKGPGATVLKPPEIVTAVLIPKQVSGRCSAYRRVHIRHSVDIALVCAAARLEWAGGRISAARIALGAVAPTPICLSEAADSIVGRPLDEEALNKVEELARQAARPITDVRASARYRTSMAGVLARRVVALCAERRQ